MFRITKDPSSGVITCTLTEITCNVSQIFIMCVVGVWRHIIHNIGLIHRNKSRAFSIVDKLKCRVMKNDCRGFNNLSCTIHLR